ncbi:hypothetical protein Q2T71_08470 [Yersinia sp. 1652 StPb PI]
MSTEREPYIYAGDLNTEELLAWLEHRLNVVKAFVRKKAAMESDLVSAAFLGREVIGCLDKDGLYGVRTSQESTLPAEVCQAQKQISEFREFLNNFGIQLKGYQGEDLPAKQASSPHN